jgi:phage shock protein PspC (stress-responsive transcriptional regulator)
MNEQSATVPSTGLDRFFGALRALHVRRRTDDKWLGGVCSGLADRLGVDPVIVRVALVVLSIFWGFGVMVYLTAWVLLPDDKGEIAAQRAIRDGDHGSIVLLIFAAFALFGALTWTTDHVGPFLIIPLVAFVWWLTHRSHKSAESVRADQAGTPYGAGPPPTPYAAGPPPTPYAAGPPPISYAAGPPPISYAAGPPPISYAAGPPPISYGAGPPPTPPAPVVKRRPRRRSGGPLMIVVAIGLALVTYGSLTWLGTQFDWNGNHSAIALAGSLATIGLLIVGLGVAGWRAGFLTFLAVLLAITAFSSTLVPKGIQFDASFGDANWAPTPVTLDSSYRLGAGNGVLDLRGLPTEGLSGAKIPAYIGVGELKVLVPEGLTVKVVGHVALGNIIAPEDAGNTNQGGGTDQARTIVVGGGGPTEVVVDAGVGIGQLIVIKE